MQINAVGMNNQNSLTFASANRRPTNRGPGSLGGRAHGEGNGGTVTGRVPTNKSQSNPGGNGDSGTVTG